MSKFTKFLPVIAIIVAAIVVVSVVVATTTNSPSTDNPSVDNGINICVHTGGKRTCTEPAICTLCGEAYVEARGHVSTKISAVSPTCTESGLTEGEKCLYCDKVLKAQQTVPATGHTMIKVSAEAAGCTTDGHSAYEKCSSCDYTEGKTVIPAGHSFTDVAALDATCTEDGYTTHKQCLVCGETEGKEILPAGHSFGDPDANGTKTCSACGLVEVSTSEGLKAAIEGGVANINVLAGTYLTNVKVPAGSNITIVGAGEATVLEGQIATTSSDEGTLTLRDLVINVNDKIVDSTGISQTGKSAIAIWGNQTVVCENVTFNMSLSNSTAITSWWDTGVGTSIVVRNCVFNANGQRPIRATGNVTVENTTFNDPYRYAVQLTAKASTATLMDKAIINFNNNTIVNGASGKSLVYGIQFEGEDYGCHDLVVNGAGNTIVAGEWDTANESAMYFCECCPKVDHDTIEFNVEVEVVHEGHTYGNPDANGTRVCTACGFGEINTIAGLQAAIDAATGNAVIEISADLQGDLTITQKPDVSITIEGNGHEFNGSIVVDGKSARYTTASAIIQNLVFNAEGISADACVRLGNGNNATRYTNGVTVKNCTFNGVNNEKVAVKSYTGGDHYVVIEGCTVNAGMHSLAQLTNVEKGLKIIDCKVYSKNGANLNNTLSLEMSGCEFDVTGYAIRFGVNGSVNADAKSFNISDSTLKSACADSDDAVIVFRSSSTNSVLNLTNTTLEGSVEFYGNTEATMICIDGMLAVKTAQQLASVVAMGYDNIWLEDGEYNIASCGNKTLTISGTRNAVIKVYNEGEDGCDYGFDGSTVTFNGVTIDTTANTGNYKGYARLQATFNDCAFFGAYTAHRVQTFNNCEFDFNNGYFWVWGSTELNFNGCVFGGNSKAILAHGGASTVININNCNFAATAQGFTGSGDNTAAIEIDPTGSNVYTINFTGDNTITGSYAGWTRVKDGSTGHVVTGLE